MAAILSRPQCVKAVFFLNDNKPLNWVVASYVTNNMAEAEESGF